MINEFRLFILVGIMMLYMGFTTKTVWKKHLHFWGRWKICFHELWIGAWEYLVLWKWQHWGNKEDLRSDGREGCYLVNGYYEGYINEAFERMNEMTGCGYLPVASTLNALIVLVCKRAKVGKTSNLIEEINDSDCLLYSGSYSPFIDIINHLS